MVHGSRVILFGHIFLLLESFYFEKKLLADIPMNYFVQCFYLNSVVAFSFHDLLHSCFIYGVESPVLLIYFVL